MISLDFTSLSFLSYVVQPIRLYLILMSILLYGYEQPIDCTSQVERIMVKVEGLQKMDPPRSKLFDLISKVSKFRQIKEDKINSA
jgi:hypothetical protein